MRAYRPRLLLPAALAVLAARASAQGPAAQSPAAGPAPVAPHSKVLKLGDYGRWSRITSNALSADGAWLTYTLTPNDGDATVYVRRLADTLTYTIAAGSAAEFSDDGRWLAALTQPAEKEAERLRRARRPIPRTAVLLDLATGHRDTVPNAASITFAEGGRWVAIKRARLDTASKAQGTDVVLRDLATGTVHHLGSVGQLSFNEPSTRASKRPSTLVAYTVDAPDRAGNGIYLLELGTGRTTPLLTAAETFDGLAWDESGTRLAALHGVAPEKMKYRANAVVAFTALDTPKPARVDLAPSAAPKDFVLSENATPSWSRDGARVFVGLRGQEIDPAKSDDPVANVDVWHWRDADIQSVQMVRAEQERRYTYAASFELGARRLVRLANDSMRVVTNAPGGALAIGRDDAPYRGTLQWGGAKGDYYAIDPATGARSLIGRGLTRTMGTSPDGRWFLYLQNGKVLAQDLRAPNARAVDLGAAAGVDFVDADDDHPYERPVYGVAGWSKDGRSVLLHHRFDVWQVPLAGGKAVNLTHGAGDSAQIHFRVVRLDRAAPARGARGAGGDADDDGIDLAKPLVLSAYGEWTKQSGYWVREPNGTLRPLVYGDEMIGGLAKAERGDRVVFTRQTFAEFPDLWTSGDVASIAKAAQVTNANPQLVDYAWGRRVLVDFTNAKGQRLQGTLALPANYQAGKKYPMIVYFYEKVSQQHHQFSMPVYDDRPHFSAYASDGYLVFMPDIVYEEGKPGSSALDCVTSGVKKVIELGYADPQRIGIQGHSWGGYESSFIITQTDMFKAAVIGAPPADLVSMYDQLYKNTGTVNNGIFELGQVRMGAEKNPWSAHALYESQSPVHQVQNIKTPFLILQGTDDGAVDWLQGVELYNAARRFGKNVILLSYPGENHHLAKKENTKDFQVRMKQYFDHYLKDALAPSWMTDGVPNLRKGLAAP